MTIHEVINVVSVRNGLVSAVRTMHMILVVAVALMLRRTIRWILITDVQLVLDNRPIRFLMVQVTVMEVIDMIAMLNSCVATIWAMFVTVVGVGVFRHENALSLNKPGLVDSSCTSFDCMLHGIAYQTNDMLICQ